LRFVDDSLLEQQFACPDCRQGIEILRGDGVWSAIPAKNFAPAPVEKKPAAKSRQTADVQSTAPQRKETPAAINPVKSSERLAEWIGDRAPKPAPSQPRRKLLDGMSRKVSSGLAPWFAWLKSPIAVVWTVAGFVTLTIIVWLLRDHSSSRNTATPDARTRPSAEQDGGPPPDGALSPLEEQLRLLGGRIDAFQQEQGRLPAGRSTLLDDGATTQFSWLAELESANPSTSRPGPIPLWERGWRDPLNDGFVRRRLPALINSAVTLQAGEDGYPPTHFVGVAGLGPDGPTLPVDHPWAGVFGYDRVTRLEDIKDGQSNTIMVAGVTGRLGSWADADSSIRSFTEAPYINGPDGFGTGQQDGMFVLMADGSVKFLSTETNPVVMRRMLAMNDGLPLDPATPGDPLDIVPPAMVADADPPAVDIDAVPEQVDPPETVEPELSPEMQLLANEPIEVPIAIDPPRVFIERSLQVSLRRFEQREPVELRLMLITLEELVGSRFGWNVPDTEEWEGVLDRSVTVSLENTTVAGVLSEVLASVGLTYRLEDEGIYIEPR
jgi:hypothetical protein